MNEIDPSLPPGSEPRAAGRSAPGATRRGSAASAEAYKTACEILEHVELMIELAEDARMPDGSRALLDRAKVEAERVIRSIGPEARTIIDG